MLTHLGQQSLGFLLSDDYPLTIPEGTTAVVLTSQRDGGITGTPSIGGINGVVSPEVGDFWLWADISGRSNDTLTITKGGNSTDVAVYYLSGTVPAWFGGAVSPSVGSSATPTNGGNVFGVWVGSGALCSYSPQTDVLYNLTTFAPYRFMGGWGDVGAPNAAVTCGADISCSLGTYGARAFIYESQVDPVFEPTAFGVEVGFQSGDYGYEFTIGSDVGLYPQQLRVEAGFQSGVSFRTSGKRQVMLTGSGIETPEMTTGGTTGQVLSFDEAGAPTWIDAGVGALDDIGDVNAPAPADNDVLTWDDYAGEWVAAAPSGGGALDDLTDVNAPAPSDNDVLGWDDYAGEWVPMAAGTPDLSSGSLDDLGDVYAPAPTDGDVLTFDDYSGEWVAAAPAAGGDITTDPAWTTAGDLIVADGDDSAVILPAGDEDDVLTIVSGVPAWAAPSGGPSSIPPALKVFMYDTFK